nr:hypothetical protein [Tanacetum cinerariifolium]
MVNLILHIRRYYALSWKPCQGDSLNLPDHSGQDTDKDEDPSTGSDRGLKKKKTSKDAEPAKRNQSLWLHTQICHKIKSRSWLMMKKNPRKRLHLNVTGSPNPTQPQERTIPDWNTFNELMSTPIDFSAFIMNDLNINNLTQETLLRPAFRLLKGTRSNYAELEYDFDECYMALLQKLNWVEVMRKHGYGYLRGIEVRRADNNLYRFEEGNFPRLRINDIEGMLLFVVHNRLINLSGDDIFDFTIALRMFTKSLVIQKRVKDLQLGVKSYQKKINVTKPKTTKTNIRKVTHTLHIKTLKDSFMSTTIGETC